MVTINNPTQNEYWKNLNDRQRLNDAVHKIAQNRFKPYAYAWTIFFNKFSGHLGRNLAHEKGQYKKTSGAEMTIPDFIEKFDLLPAAIDFALTLAVQNGR